MAYTSQAQETWNLLCNLVVISMLSLFAAGSKLPERWFKEEEVGNMAVC